MGYPRAVADNFIRQISSEEAEILEFKGALTVKDMFSFHSPEGNLSACYITQLCGRRTIMPTNHYNHSVHEGSIFSSIAPSLAEFGNDLAIGETIVVSGRGRIRNVIEHTNGAAKVLVVHEIVLFIRFPGADMGVVVRVFVRPDDVPREVIGTFILGDYVHFRGYLCCRRKIEDIINVEVVSHNEMRRG
ncbi:hypothetical protein, variant [Puccinia triticina 1-1 BBBD Race 1]|uniref:Uncharacterized protein n=1 Tax=Puccinia triticina (isolate 1-1 / race 1 (BBBD)) TaxID=630390 RepID=A0A180G1S5_PUCT1|nr:hypothetical protein, variant [Puccinia triticina 1-1 BBBD Race 1]